MTEDKILRETIELAKIAIQSNDNFKADDVNATRLVAFMKIIHGGLTKLASDLR